MSTTTATSSGASAENPVFSVDVPEGPSVADQARQRIWPSPLVLEAVFLNAGVQLPLTAIPFLKPEGLLLVVGLLLVAGLLLAAGLQFRVRRRFHASEQCSPLAILES